MSDASRTPERTYTIRQLCREFDVTPRSLRFYEDKGLLSPGRQGVNRVYSHRDRGRLILILRGKLVGFSLNEIGEMLDLYDKDERHAAQMAAALGLDVKNAGGKSKGGRPVGAVSAPDRAAAPPRLKVVG